MIAEIAPFAKLAIAYRMCYFLQPEKFMNCGRNLKYSWEELAVAISQHLGALSDSKYLAETCNSALTTGIDDITGFFVPSKCQLCWRYLQSNLIRYGFNGQVFLQYILHSYNAL
ncbi:MAG: hypothetical protein JRJ46_13305 [Deltaproteobacteria bacterium]|nr:hypothetical protein [Deltaproteobacteria bacterium]